MPSLNYDKKYEKLTENKITIKNLKKEYDVITYRNSVTTERLYDKWEIVFTDLYPWEEVIIVIRQYNYIPQRLNFIFEWIDFEYVIDNLRLDEPL